MMRKLAAVLVLAIGLVGMLVPAALAAKSDVHVQKVLAQDDCGGGVCITDDQTDFGVSIDPRTVKDPPGATVRSLVMIALLTTGFVVYLRLALVRGAKIG